MNFPLTARSQEMVDAGGAGETARRGSLSEVGIKTCNAGTDSALEAHATSCDACRRANV